MPLARIITHSVEAADPVIKQLRARGYTVETRLPGESSDKPADLEIVLEKVDSQQVLLRATDLAKTTGAAIYVGAGAFRAPRVDAPAPHHNGPRTLPVPSVEDTVNGVAAGLQNKRDLLAKAIWEQRANMREARRLQRERISHEQARFAAEAERLRAQEAEGARAEAEAERERMARAEAEAQVVAAAESERQRIAAGEAERQRVAEIVAFEQAQRAERERVERAERERAERERLAAQETETRRQAERAAQQHFLHASGTVQPAHNESFAGQQHAAEPAPVARQDVAPTDDFTHRPRTRPLPAKPQSRRRAMRSRAREWRAAVVVSSIFALLLMLAWRAVTRGPVSPLPAAVSNQPNLQQEVPFGGVTLSPPADVSENFTPAAHSAGKALRPIPADLHTSSRPATTVDPSESVRHEAVSQPSKPSSKQTGAKRSNPRPKHRADAEEATADDEVIIRHFTPKRAAAPPSAQKASLKRFSDLDE